VYDDVYDDAVFMMICL